MISLGRVRSSSPSQAVVSRQLLPNFYLFTVLYILNVLAMWSMVPTAKGYRNREGGQQVLFVKAGKDGE